MLRRFYGNPIRNSAYDILILMAFVVTVIVCTLFLAYTTDYQDNSLLKRMCGNAEHITLTYNSLITALIMNHELDLDQLEHFVIDNMM